MGRRFTEEQLQALREIDTPTLSNAIELFKARDRTEGFMGMEIRCWFPQLGTMLGYAVTAKADCTTPGEPPGREGWFKLWKALEGAPKPAVVVVQDDSPDRSRSCHFGEVMANTAKRLGAVGVVTDGGVRDVREAEALGFHYFAPGFVCSHGNFAVKEVGAPVRVGGIAVRPGDLIHADVNGVLVIPDEMVEQLPDAVERIRVRERRVIEYVNGPDFTVEGLRELFSH